MARHERWKTTIREEARALGFDSCRFTAVVAPPHADFVRAWLEAGNQAAMAYLEKGLAKRLDPTLILSSARSIVSLTYRYQPPPIPRDDWRASLRGRIAAYAFGEDYHRILEDKLDTLAAKVRSLDAGIEVKRCVDVGAVLEREWAALSGVGWFGKNTNILNTAQGSYFFLAELLTNLEIDADPPVADHCGTCTRCLDLCPTQALAPDYRLDARRCISFWTIEHRGAVPQEMRAAIGNWIFGCDVCQEVCPWNDKAYRDFEAAAAGELQPYLPDLLRLDEEEFRERYRRTSIWRVKRDGFVRNAVVALGNTGNREALPFLAQTLGGDRSALVRAHAAWAIGRIGGNLAADTLRHALPRETDPAAQIEITTALHQLANHESREA